MSRATFYDEDLAYIHHTGFGDFARSAGPEVLPLLRAAAIRRGKLVDLACGSGIWAALALRRGFEVVGVDQSAAMIRLARQVAPDATFHRASLHEFKLPACDAITILGEGLNYLAPGERAGQRLDRFFARAARALRPSGLLIFDVMVQGPKRTEGRGWRQGKDWAVLFERWERDHVLYRKSISFRKVQGRWRRSEETHRVQLFARGEIVRALRRAHFVVRVARRYGKFELLPRRLAFVARRV